MGPAAQKFAADDAETVGGDCWLDDRAEVRAAAFDILVDGEQEAAEVLARFEILRGEESVWFIGRFFRQIQQAQHVGDDFAAWRVARDVFHESEGGGRLYGETVDGVQVAHGQTDLL